MFQALPAGHSVVASGQDREPGCAERDTRTDSILTSSADDCRPHRQAETCTGLLRLRSSEHDEAPARARQSAEEHPAALHLLRLRDNAQDPARCSVKDGAVLIGELPNLFGLIGAVLFVAGSSVLAQL
jgi:hypothetical protein